MKLNDFLNKEEDSRRIFGKKELKIISKQIQGIQLSQSERNRLSRDIKPKFRFIKKLSKFRNEFKLEKNQNNKKIIKKAVNVILNDKLKDNIKAIFLFGSFADNTPTTRSDIDVCVLFKKDLSLTQATRFRIRISGELPDKFDIQVFNILPFKIKKGIARNHIVLYKISSYDNINFSIKYLKDMDYSLRMRRIFGNET